MCVAEREMPMHVIFTSCSTSSAPSSINAVSSPSFTVVMVPTTVPSNLNSSSTVAHAFWSPRYSHVTGHCVLATQVFDMPTLEMRINDAVGEGVGTDLVPLTLMLIVIGICVDAIQKKQKITNNT